MEFGKEDAADDFSGDDCERFRTRSYGKGYRRRTSSCALLEMRSADDLQRAWHPRSIAGVRTAHDHRVRCGRWLKNPKKYRNKWSLALWLCLIRSVFESRCRCFQPRHNFTICIFIYLWYVTFFLLFYLFIARLFFISVVHRQHIYGMHRSRRYVVEDVCGFIFFIFMEAKVQYDIFVKSRCWWLYDMLHAPRAINELVKGVTRFEIIFFFFFLVFVGIFASVK